MSDTSYDRTRRAAERVEELTGFYVHAAIFAIINVLLILINVTITDDIIWAHWVFLGWGVGLAAHAVSVFGQMPGFVTRWQIRKMRQLRREI